MVQQLMSTRHARLREQMHVNLMRTRGYLTAGHSAEHQYWLHSRVENHVLLTRTRAHQGTVTLEATPAIASQR